jgi:hypothetical protein
MLLGIIYMYNILGTTDYMTMLTFDIPANIQN